MNIVRPHIQIFPESTEIYLKFTLSKVFGIHYPTLRIYFLRKFLKHQYSDYEGVSWNNDPTSSIYYIYQCIIQYVYLYM